jgi:hypothetical protein
LLTDVTDEQSAWEQSGWFEGDIRLTEEQQRNGIIDPGSRWPNGVVPFVIDDIFSEYYSTVVQIGMQGVEGNIHAF